MRIIRRLLSIAVAFVLVGAYLTHSTTGLAGLLSAPPTPHVPLTGTYMATDNQRPVSWNPCAPIDYVVNFTNAPPFASSDLARAISMLELATGFHFVYTGSTSVVPSSSWALSKRLGRSSWAPLIIAFASHNQTNMFTYGADQLGSGGSAWVNSPRGKVDVSGAVVIDDQTKYLPGFGSGLRLGTLFLHELGHVLGLAEGPDPSSFTYQYLGVTNQTITPLDRAHLRTLSQGGCRPAPAPSWA